jgi:rhomboid protease GluP
MDDRPVELVVIYASHARRRCDERAFVLQAMGIRSLVMPAHRAYALLVEAADAGPAREQLRLYWQENHAGQSRFDSRLHVDDGLVCASLYGLTILLFDMLARNGALALDWWRAGVSQAGLIQGGEWWRALTALTLHGNAAHLASNLVFGLIFAFFAGGLLGWGLGWAGMFFAGALGNLLDALLQRPEHNAIGASTAVFAAVGILGAYAWQRRGPRVNRWVPLGAGVALFAFVGTGGERTDVLAHATGLAAGYLFGLAFGMMESRALLAAWHKHALGLAAFTALILAWTIALQTHG